MRYEAMLRHYVVTGMKSESEDNRLHLGAKNKRRRLSLSISSKNFPARFMFFLKHIISVTLHSSYLIG